MPEGLGPRRVVREAGIMISFVYQTLHDKDVPCATRKLWAPALPRHTHAKACGAPSHHRPCDDWMRGELW